MHFYKDNRMKIFSSHRLFFFFWDIWKASEPLNVLDFFFFILRNQFKCLSVTSCLHYNFSLVFIVSCSFSWLQQENQVSLNELFISATSPLNLRFCIHSGFFTFKINSYLFALYVCMCILPFVLLPIFIQCQNTTELWLQSSTSNTLLDTWKSFSVAKIQPFISANSATTNIEKNGIMKIKGTKSGKDIEVKGGTNHVFLCHVHDRGI